MDEQPYRWILAAVLGLAVSISGFYRHRARQRSGVIARREESPRLIALRLLIGLPLLLSLLAFIIWPSLIAWAKAPFPMPLRWTGAALGTVAIGFVFWVMRSIGSNISETVLTKQQHELVTHGPYQFIRHPLYATGLLLLIAATLLASSWLIGSLTLIAAIGIRTFVVPREEAALIDKFGDRYREYMRRTGALLPGSRP